MVKVKQLPRRQRIRKAFLLVSLLLFPITIYYFSPYLIVDGAAQGIINGSFLVFGLMFVSALFVGRLWCGWLCPAGALQDCGAAINNGRGRGGRFNWTKWAIWIPWIAIIAVLAVQAGGYHAVDPFYNLEGGVTLAQPYWYVIYYFILALFLGLAVAFGRRAGCHHICWMAPFMIIGRRIRNAFKWPALRLQAEPNQCSDCLRCTRSCPMSLDVHQMVQAQDMENDECILCGTCVDGCTKSAIRFSFSTGRETGIRTRSDARPLSSGAGLR
jgi:ferredoxin-type protein NapH